MKKTKLLLHFQNVIWKSLGDVSFLYLPSIQLIQLFVYLNLIAFEAFETDSCPSPMRAQQLGAAFSILADLRVISFPTTKHFSCVRPWKWIVQRSQIKPGLKRCAS